FLLVGVPVKREGQVELDTRLTHDTLAPLIRKLFDESDRPGQRARRILESRAGEWKGDPKGASPGQGQGARQATDVARAKPAWKKTPLDEANLKTVENGLKGMRDLRSEEQDLLRASRNEQARRERNRRLLTRAAVTAAALFLGLGVFAGWQWYQARKARDK